MNVRLFFICLLSGLLFSGCSVKEDRSACPCRLRLDFSGLDTSLVGALNVLAFSEDGMIFTDRIEAYEFAEPYIRNVSRGRLRINIWNGPDDRSDGADGICIPYGCECPQLYMQSLVADATDESCEEKVLLRKNHCRLTVVMDGNECVPYSFTFRGNVDGYEADGRPSEGEFSCVAYPSDDGASHALIPRQIDNSLILNVDDGTKTVKTFAVGEYIAATGYDWSVPDLQDVTIVIDYSVTYIKIAVAGWNKEYLYNIVL